ncbi:hypothetical protein NEMBOFW57_005522 [Staphylotrichum longicolle]|uniref:Uncharacterized protein n=1 Tax=Staphylotrichum longicolle TaxID=669026 RepID=A0AAD4HW44_9PEZI|nr:hypothetical protein NEMBOFW57_005522 [Staphylotrichum longicolle]
MSANLAPTSTQQVAEQTQTHTPPPSDNDVVPLPPMPMEVTATGAIKLPGLRSLQQNRASKPPARAGGCGPNGPGTCAQCLADPKPPTAAATTTPNGATLGLSLSCAEAYKTISSHRHFDEAADDIGSWLPKLRALPIPRSGPLGARGGRGGDGRAPIEVEAASIMSVLKDFDVRFGRGE